MKLPCYRCDAADCACPARYAVDVHVFRSGPTGFAGGFDTFYLCEMHNDRAPQACNVQDNEVIRHRRVSQPGIYLDKLLLWVAEGGLFRR
jgi:hypothetical protein